MKKILIAAIALLLIAGGAYAANKNSNDKNNTKTTTDTTTKTNSQNTNKPANNDFGSSQTIIYDNNGFSPQKLTSKSGEKVTIQNKSSQAIQLDSDPHPIHTDDPELNVGTVAAGESKSFTLTTKGSFGFHNHLDPSKTGTIVVQ